MEKNREGEDLTDQRRYKVIQNKQGRVNHYIHPVEIVLTGISMIKV